MDNQNKNITTEVTESFFKNEIPLEVSNETKDENIVKQKDGNFKINNKYLLLLIIPIIGIFIIVAMILGIEASKSININTYSSKSTLTANSYTVNTQSSQLTTQTNVLTKEAVSSTNTTNGQSNTNSITSKSNIVKNLIYDNNFVKFEYPEGSEIKLNTKNNISPNKSSDIYNVTLTHNSNKIELYGTNFAEGIQSDQSIFLDNNLEFGYIVNFVVEKDQNAIPTYTPKDCKAIGYINLPENNRSNICKIQKLNKGEFVAKKYIINSKTITVFSSSKYLNGEVVIMDDTSQLWKVAGSTLLDFTNGEYIVKYKKAVGNIGENFMSFKNMKWEGGSDQGGYATVLNITCDKNITNSQEKNDSCIDVTKKFVESFIWKAEMKYLTNVGKFIKFDYPEGAEIVVKNNAPIKDTDVLSAEITYNSNKYEVFRSRFGEGINSNQEVLLDFDLKFAYILHHKENELINMVIDKIDKNCQSIGKYNTKEHESSYNDICRIVKLNNNEFVAKKYQVNGYELVLFSSSKYNNGKVIVTNDKLGETKNILSSTVNELIGNNKYYSKFTMSAGNISENLILFTNKGWPNDRFNEGKPYTFFAMNCENNTINSELKNDICVNVGKRIIESFEWKN